MIEYFSMSEVNFIIVAMPISRAYITHYRLLPYQCARPDDGTNCVIMTLSGTFSIATSNVNSKYQKSTLMIAHDYLLAVNFVFMA